MGITKTEFKTVGLTAVGGALEYYDFALTAAIFYKSKKEEICIAPQDADILELSQGD